MTNSDIATIFCVLTVMGMILVALLLLRMQRGWPQSNDDVFRQRFQLPQRRLLPRLRLPQIRLSRRPAPLTLAEEQDLQQEEVKKVRLLAQKGEETSVASRLSVKERRALYGPPIPPPGPPEGYQGHGQRGGIGPRALSPPSSPDTATPAETPPSSST